MSEQSARQVHSHDELVSQHESTVDNLIDSHIDGAADDSLIQLEEALRMERVQRAINRQNP